MKTSDFDYVLPQDRIAQTPVEPRHNSKLLILRRAEKMVEHSIFWNLDQYLNSGDLLVINRTRVIPARIYAQKASGGKIEILLLSKKDENIWEVLVGGKRMNEGATFSIQGGSSGKVIQNLEGSRRIVEFDELIEPQLHRIGQMPLPPYIHEKLTDPERYQTVYSRDVGSAAAPTAGLHFTPVLIEKLKSKGIHFADVTLHVGLDTFAPVNEDDPARHVIHTEWCLLPKATAEAVNEAKANGRRVIAVGTTSVRTLESAARQARAGETIGEYSGPTNLFILPGYEFKAVDSMITNFHLPKSTLLMLVSAFAGRELIRHAYAEAIRLNYRFYSFGDAMLIF